MIYVYLNGRFGNYLFQFVTGLSLSSDVTLIAPSKKIYNEVRKYPSIFGDVPIIQVVPENIQIFQQKSFYYEDIPYTGNDIIIKGDFQSYRYLKFNTSLLFKDEPDDVKIYLKTSGINPIDYIGVHVRRGDYMKLPHRHPFCGKQYYLTAFDKFPADTKFLICSDDLDWCKKNFIGERFLFIDSGSAIIDFYLMAKCKSNIISNSTFSWWTSFINNERKIIIAPSRWFGIQLKNRSIKDLYLPQTEVVQCHYELSVYLKALFLLYKDSILGIVRKIGLKK